MEWVVSLVTGLSMIALVGGPIVIVANYAVLLINLRSRYRGDVRGRRYEPFTGPLLCTIALGLVTFVDPPPSWLFVAPWIADPGTWFGLARARTVLRSASRNP